MNSQLCTYLQKIYPLWKLLPEFWQNSGHLPEQKLFGLFSARNLTEFRNFDVNDPNLFFFYKFSLLFDVKIFENFLKGSHFILKYYFEKAEKVPFGLLKLSIIISNQPKFIFLTFWRQNKITFSLNWLFLCLSSISRSGHVYFRKRKSLVKINKFYWLMRKILIQMIAFFLGTFNIEKGKIWKSLHHEILMPWIKMIFLTSLCF